jgi:hypothetical protein
MPLKKNFLTLPALSRAAALMGAKGGAVKTTKAKGFRAISRQRNREIALMGVAARRAKREAL